VTNQSASSSQGSGLLPSTRSLRAFLEANASSFINMITDFPTLNQIRRFHNENGSYLSLQLLSGKAAGLVRNY